VSHRRLLQRAVESATARVGGTVPAALHVDRSVAAPGRIRILTEQLTKLAIEEAMR
jgi:hypothetical protein